MLTLPASNDAVLQYGEAIILIDFHVAGVCREKPYNFV
jgi:hypothetical protein